MDKSTWDKLGIETSRLGFGCMRFPTLPTGEIDEAQAEEMLDKAYQSGITYFDTAWMYHDGKSEAFMGKCLSKYPRDSYTIATKLPVMMLKSLDDAKKTFEEQLRRLGQDYVDFYLLHGMNARSYKSAVELGMVQYCEELKKEGRIKYLGFSFHDDYPVFEEIIKSRSWDFCQIQLNYMDTNEQAGLKGCQLAKDLGVPVVIMEPAKGGALAVLPDYIEAEFKAINPNASAASWAMRWIGGLDGVNVVLSGMTAMSQLEDNLKTFSDFKPLSAEEQAAVERVTEMFRKRVKNGCTACRYCMPCPVGVDIPGNFGVWNKFGMFENDKEIAFWWTAMTPDAGKAKNCIQCGQCEEKCPQKLNIRDDLATLQKELDGVVAAQQK